MGYPTKLLSSGEVIKVDLKPHWLYFLGPATVTIVSIIVAILVVLAAMVVTLKDRGGLYLPPLAILTVVLYTVGYFIRLAVMTKVSKSGDPASVRQYFVEEKVFALPLSVAILAAIYFGGAVSTH